MGAKTKDQLQGTIDLLVLRILASSGEGLHGYTIAERVESVSQDMLRIEEGSLYPALHRMDEAGWVKSRWGFSENNRRARYYAITRKGRGHLAKIEKDWAAHVDAVARVLRLA
jgi:PadR family transcriptional regulator, regulatory protein PadR